MKKILKNNSGIYPALLFREKSSAGFTLLEILVALGIFVLMIAGFVWLLLFSSYSKKVVWEQLETQNEGRKIIQNFVNELRSASDSSIGGYALEIATDDEIVFYSNIDEDTYRERIRYFLDGSTLKRGLIKPTSTPLQYFSADEIITEEVHDVSASSTPLFSYYDEDFNGTGVALTEPVSVTQVRMVKINLVLEEDPHLSPTPFAIQSKVQIRNLKEN